MLKLRKPLLIATVCLFGFAAVLAQAAPPAHAGKPSQPGPPAHVTLPPQAAVPGPPAQVPPASPSTPPVSAGQATPPAQDATPGPPAHVTLPPQAAAPGPPAQVPPPKPPAEPEEDPPATVNVIHGIPNLPSAVTVCSGGEALIEDFEFEDIAKLQLPAGTYDLQIVVGGSCADPAALELLGVEVEAGGNYSIVAHLTGTGDPAVTAFVNSLAPAMPGYARLVLHHLAQEEPVQARVGRLTESALDITTGAISNGGGAYPGEVRPGMWQIELFLDGTVTSVLGPLEVLLHPKTSYLIYVVGAAPDLKVLVVAVPLPVK